MSEHMLGAPEEVPAISAAENKKRLKSPEEVWKVSAPAEHSRLSRPAEQSRLSAPEDAARLKGPEDMQRLSAPDATFDMIVSLEDAVTLKKVRSMKDAKIDHFIDEEMGGHLNEQVCEDIISFLKTDIALIDMILSIEITSRSDIENKIRSIVEFVEAADEPRHQKNYLNALNFEEKDLEGEYNMVLKRLDAVISGRYSYVLKGSDSAFFQ